ncbi:MAG: hypothetical protein RDV48_24285 [Candidatus Eremiobacteraeota bacterium]|nr:hypothetical protein [Candidatus Eremiobacteraeota bacterium]
MVSSFHLEIHEKAANGEIKREAAGGQPPVLRRARCRAGLLFMEVPLPMDMQPQRRSMAIPQKTWFIIYAVWAFIVLILVFIRSGIDTANCTHAMNFLPYLLVREDIHPRLSGWQKYVIPPCVVILIYLAGGALIKLAGSMFSLK